jgi:hypothetical protein
MALKFFAHKDKRKHAAVSLNLQSTICPYVYGGRDEKWQQLSTQWLKQLKQNKELSLSKSDTRILQEVLRFHGIPLLYL